MRPFTHICKMPVTHRALWAFISLLLFAFCSFASFEALGFREDLSQAEANAGEALRTLISLALALLCISAGAGWVLQRSCIQSFQRFMQKSAERYGSGTTFGQVLAR